jgi:hypothetical protein
MPELPILEPYSQSWHNKGDENEELHHERRTTE